MQVSVNDFIVRAAALALQQVPSANAFWDAKAEKVRPGSGVDVAVAVATDKGLITPIVKAANTKSLTQVGQHAVIIKWMMIVFLLGICIQIESRFCSDVS